MMLADVLIILVESTVNGRVSLAVHKTCAYARAQRYR